MCHINTVQYTLPLKRKWENNNYRLTLSSTNLYFCSLSRAVSFLTVPYLFYPCAFYLSSCDFYVFPIIKSDFDNSLSVLYCYVFPVPSLSPNIPLLNSQHAVFCLCQYLQCFSLSKAVANLCSFKSIYLNHIIVTQCGYFRSIH